VRVISATNRNLSEVISSGGFREDLYYRLSVVPILVPALRERPQDIQPLAGYFLEDFCRRNNFRPKRLEPATVTTLETYHWPGNARELRNAVERIAILTPGESIPPESLPYEIREAEGSGPRSTLREARDAAEREHILRALDQSDWNVAAAARILLMERTNLHKKIRSLGLRRG
jgi:two-component system nitrogen regulation response regulator NtrX